MRQKKRTEMGCNRAIYDTIQEGDRIIVGLTELEVATVISTHTSKGQRRNKIQTKFPHKSTIYSVFYCPKTDRTYLDTRIGYVVLTPENVASKDQPLNLPL